MCSREAIRGQGFTPTSVPLAVIGQRNPACQYVFSETAAPRSGLRGPGEHPYKRTVEAPCIACLFLYKAFIARFAGKFAFFEKGIGEYTQSTKTEN